jgi:hypothetical protein
MGKKIDKNVVLPIIAEIKVKNDEIKALIDALPESSMKQAFVSSFENLDNKCDVYSAPSLTKEERKVVRGAAKSALEAFRNSKTQNEVSSDNADMGTESDGAGTGSKKSKRH